MNNLIKYLEYLSAKIIKLSLDVENLQKDSIDKAQIDSELEKIKTVNKPFNFPLASKTDNGLIRIASLDETKSGNNDTLAITPRGLAEVIKMINKSIPNIDMTLINHLKDYLPFIRRSIANGNGEKGGGDVNRAVVDIFVPNSVGKFIDNVLTIQNKSTDGNIYGNAAIAFLDGAGIERGAIGYSRNSAIQPNGYYPDSLYVECGDAFAGDNNPSDFRLIVTQHPASPYFPNTSFNVIHHETKNGRTTIRGRGAKPNIDSLEFSLGNGEAWIANKSNNNSNLSLNRLIYWHADGNTLVGQTTKSAGANGQMSVTADITPTAITAKTSAAADQPVQILYHQNASGNNKFLTFATDSDYTPRASITYNRAAGQVAYNTTSDYRAKTVHGDFNDALDIVNQMHVVDATMHNAKLSLPMFIAHELQEIAPYSVTGVKDEVDDEGQPVYQQVDLVKLVPLLTRAIQELSNEIKELKNKAN